jgi:membrane protein
MTHDPDARQARPQDPEQGPAGVPDPHAGPQASASRQPRNDALPAQRHTPAAWWRLGKQVFSASLDDDVPSMGAALAYYTVFSMAPLLLIVIAVAGLVFGADAARGEIQAQLQGLMGASGADVVQGLLASLNERAQGLTATALGVVLLLVGATTVFAALQNALDRIWRIGPRQQRRSGFYWLLRARLLSFGMILVVGFLLVVSLLTSAILSAVSRRWEMAFGTWQTYIDAINAGGGFLLVALMFGLIYKVMPRARVAWGDVWLGALLAALLFTLGKVLIGAYIGRSGLASAYGAAGSLVVILLWVYFSAQILLIGAEFSHAYAGMFGSRSRSRAQRGQPVWPAAPAAPGDRAARR